MDESDSRSSSEKSGGLTSGADGDADAEPEPIGSRGPEVGGRLIIEISEEDGEWSGFGDIGTAVAVATRTVSEAAELDFEPALATVALSNDSRVRGLNALYRQQDKPTNVLSFPAPEGTPSDIEGRAFLGDVVLAAETIAREAQDLGIPPAHHLQHLVVHGLLHLIGFDHEADEEAEEMEALETALLARIGIADPYVAADR